MQIVHLSVVVPYLFVCAYQHFVFVAVLQNIRSDV